MKILLPPQQQQTNRRTGADLHQETLDPAGERRQAVDLRVSDPGRSEATDPVVPQQQSDR